MYLCDAWFVDNSDQKRVIRVLLTVHFVIVEVTKIFSRV